MRILILLGMVAALTSCTAPRQGNEQQHNAPAAGTSAATPVPADKFEVRFQLAKASLPATLTAEPSGKDQVATRTEITGKDLAAVVSAVNGRVTSGSLGPKCFHVCEEQCFGAGENQTCVPRCHVECID